MYKWFLSLLMLSTIFPFTTLGKTVDFHAEVDKNKVVLGRAVQLSLVFEGEQNVPAPELPAMDNFQSRYLGPMSRFSMVNGQTAMSVTHRYLLLPRKAGTFQIGPFFVTFEGQSYTVEPIAIEVLDKTEDMETATQTDGQTAPELSLENRIFLTLETQKTKAYMDEPIPLTVKLYSHKLPVRIENLPEVSHTTGFSVGEFEKPGQHQEVRNGLSFDVIEFKTTVYAARSGLLTLGPATQKAILVLRKTQQRPSAGDDFFNAGILTMMFGGWEEPYPLDLKSAPLNIDVMPLPENGKPADFTGAVGVFGLKMSAQPQSLKEGDPVTLTLSVTGSGNFQTVPAPSLGQTEGFKIYDAKLVNASQTGKQFEQVVLPMATQIKKTPTAHFSYFNPQTATYETVTAGPFDLSVGPQGTPPSPGLSAFSAAQPKQPPQENEKAHDIVFIKEYAGSEGQDARPYAHPFFWILQASAMSVLAAAAASKKHKDRIKNDVRFSRRLQAPRKARAGARQAEQLLRTGPSAAFYEQVQKTLKGYLGDRFHAPAAGLTIQTALQFLKEKNIDEETQGQVIVLFEECDTVRFAGVAPAPSQMEKTLHLLLHVIEHLERSKT